MTETGPKPNEQVEKPCPTCKARTKQAHLEGLDWWCTICCEVHTLDPEATNETLKAMMQLMSEDQKLARQLGTI